MYMISMKRKSCAYLEENALLARAGDFNHKIESTGCILVRM